MRQIVSAARLIIWRHAVVGHAPADAFSTAPVTIRAASEARNAAALAVSVVCGDTFSRVIWASAALACCGVMFIRLAIAWVVSWMVRLSEFAAVRTHTTLTPAVPSSRARLRVRSRWHRTRRRYLMNRDRAGGASGHEDNHAGTLFAHLTGSCARGDEV